MPQRAAAARRRRTTALGLAVAAWALSLLGSGALGGCYVLHLAKGQLDLVNGQRPLDVAVRDERDPVRRALLAEVPSIRAFAERVLGFSPSESYVGYYAVERGFLTLVLSASPRDRLKAYTRWYPIAGRVPYRSFFDEERAKRAQAELEAQGYDTYLHSSPAYSTLGFFRDPITTPMLERGPPCPKPTSRETLDGCLVAGLAETLIHELTHRHLYIAGKTRFNEQLASFVGRTGVIQYLASRGLYDEALRQRLLVAYERQYTFQHEAAAAARELQTLYAGPLSRAEKLARREPIFMRLESRALEIFPDSAPGKFRMNNARILQYLRYDRGSTKFERLWREAGYAWARFWPLVEREAKLSTQES